MISAHLMRTTVKCVYLLIIKFKSNPKQSINTFEALVTNRSLIEVSQVLPIAEHEEIVL